eukprot:5039567-Pleurochrysis_carterae.AAC.1
MGTCKYEEEVYVRAWLLKHGYYMGKSNVVRSSFFHHVASRLRRPAGRADRASSQQAAFAMELPSMDPLRDLLGQCEYHSRKRYADVNGEIAWIPALHRHVLPRFGDHDGGALEVRDEGTGQRSALQVGLLYTLCTTCIILKYDSEKNKMAVQYYGCTSNNVAVQALPLSLIPSLFLSVSPLSPF